MTKLRNFAETTTWLLKFRMSVYLLAYIHLIVVGLLLLTKDFERMEDVGLRLYSKLKWKLITTWFNIIAMAYIPLCIYCDWREMKDGELKYVKTLKKVRDFIFTNLLLPTTAFADILFWRLWCHDRELIVPLSVDSTVHFWQHHSMHTISLILVIFDLIFVWRERPKNLVPGILTLMVFITTYILMCLHSILNEEYVYPLMKNFSPFKLFVLIIYTYISLLFYHSGQWLIVDIIHGNRSIRKKIA